MPARLPCGPRARLYSPQSAAQSTKGPWERRAAGLSAPSSLGFQLLATPAHAVYWRGHGIERCVRIVHLAKDRVSRQIARLLCRLFAAAAAAAAPSPPPPLALSSGVSRAFFSVRLAKIPSRPSSLVGAATARGSMAPQEAAHTALSIKPAPAAAFFFFFFFTVFSTLPSRTTPAAGVASHMAAAATPASFPFASPACCDLRPDGRLHGRTGWQAGTQEAHKMEMHKGPGKATREHTQHRPRCRCRAE